MLEIEPVESKPKVVNQNLSYKFRFSPNKMF